MKLKTEENLLVVSNKKRDLNEVLDTLVSKDSKKVVGIALSITSIILGLIVAIIAGIFGLVGKAYNMFADDINTEIVHDV